MSIYWDLMHQIELGIAGHALKMEDNVRLILLVNTFICCVYSFWNKWLLISRPKSWRIYDLCRYLMDNIVLFYYKSGKHPGNSGTNNISHGYIIHISDIKCCIRYFVWVCVCLWARLNVSNHINIITACRLLSCEMLMIKANITQNANPMDHNIAFFYITTWMRLWLKF